MTIDEGIGSFPVKKDEKTRKNLSYLVGLHIFIFNFSNLNHIF